MMSITLSEVATSLNSRFQQVVIVAVEPDKVAGKLPEVYSVKERGHGEVRG